MRVENSGGLGTAGRWRSYHGGEEAWELARLGTRTVSWGESRDGNGVMLSQVNSETLMEGSLRVQVLISVPGSVRMNEAQRCVCRCWNYCLVNILCAHKWSNRDQDTYYNL